MYRFANNGEIGAPCGVPLPSPCCALCADSAPDHPSLPPAPPATSSTAEHPLSLIRRPPTSSARHEGYCRSNPIGQHLSLPYSPLAAVPRPASRRPVRYARGDTRAVRVAVRLEIGSSTMTAAICATRSLMQGIPSGRILPVDHPSGSSLCAPVPVDTSLSSVLPSACSATLLVPAPRCPRSSARPLPVRRHCFASFVSEAQHIFTVQLIVESIEAVARRSFAFACKAS